MKKIALIAGIACLIFAAFAQEIVIFEDDFESGIADWMGETPVIPELHWAIDGTDAHAGANSWWCFDEALGGYANDWLEALVTPEVDLPAMGTVTLSFWYDLSVEVPAGGFPTGIDCWDAYNVRISLDGGETFEVINPVGDYPYASSYAFYSHEGETINIPGFAGSSDGWTEVTFNLSSYAGETVVIGIFFASDVSMCAEDDPELFGLRVDDLTITAGTDVAFEDNADDVTSMEGVLLTEPPVPALMPELTTVRAVSGTHSLLAANPTPAEGAASYIIYSPEIDVPEGFLGTLSYNIYRDAPDVDGDDDGYVDDLCNVWVGIESDAGWSWNRLIYDFYGTGDPAWVLCEYDRGYTSTWTRGLFLYTRASDTLDYDCMGKTIRLAFQFSFDGNDDGGAGTGFYIDDVQVKGAYGLDYDAIVKNINRQPASLGTACRFQIELAGNGVNNATPNLFWKVINKNTGVEAGAGSVGIISVGFLETAYRTVNYTPSEPGTYEFMSYITYAADEDHSNDTARCEFVVGAHTTETGLNKFKAEQYYIYNDSETLYVRRSFFQHYDTLEDYRNGVTNIVTSPYPVSQHPVITHIGFIGWGAGSVGFKLFSYNSTDGPDMLPMDDAEWIFELPPFFPTASNIDTSGGWAFYELPTPYELNDTAFALLVCGGTTESWVTVASVFPGTTFTNARVFATSYSSLYGIYSHVSMADGYLPDLSEIHPIVRCVISAETGIKEENAARPAAATLGQNMPNPFNPTTAIAFDIPTSGNAKLEVLDLSGRTISVLCDGNMEAGNHKLVWNGSDESGNTMPSGVYFYKLTTENTTVMRKMTLLK